MLYFLHLWQKCTLLTGEVPALCDRQLSFFRRHRRPRGKCVFSGDQEPRTGRNQHSLSRQPKRFLQEAARHLQSRGRTRHPCLQRPDLPHSGKADSRQTQETYSVSLSRSSARTADTHGVAKEVPLRITRTSERLYARTPCPVAQRSTAAVCCDV